MFAEWVAAGAVFGIKAFFVVFTFFGCWMVVVLLLAALAKAFGGNGDD